MLIEIKDMRSMAHNVHNTNSQFLNSGNNSHSKIQNKNSVHSKKQNGASNLKSKNNNQHTKSDSSQPLGDGCKVVENQEDKIAEASPVHKHHDGRGALDSQILNKENSK